MADPTRQKLQRLYLGAAELRMLTDWPGALIEDYLNILDDLLTLANSLDALIGGLDTDRLVFFNSSEELDSVEDLTTWIIETAKQVLVTDNGDGTVTLSTPQDIDTDADVTFDTATLDKAIFNLTAGLTPGEGELSWNVNDGTLDLGLPGGNVRLQIGQETHAPRSRAVGANHPNGSLVYVSGATGGVPEMTLAKADASATSSGTIAMATEAITQNQLGYYTAFGLVRDVNTGGMTAGDTLYLSASTAGAYTNVKPKIPNYVIKIGTVIRAHATEGVILVNILPRTNNACNIRRNYIVPTTQTVNSGTLSSGTVADVQTWMDGNEVHIDEAAATPGYDVEYLFTNVSEFCEVVASFYYAGSSTHECQVQIYDVTNTTWKSIFVQSGLGLSHNTRFTAFPGVMSDFIDGSNQVKIRFYHPQSGNASHDLYIDYVAISGIST